MLRHPTVEGVVQPYQYDPLHHSIIPSSTQVAWIQLFQGTSTHNHQHQSGRLLRPDSPSRLPTILPPATAQDERPVIGGNHDFIIPRSWPPDVVHIDRSVFSSTRPFPALSHSEYFNEICGCEGYCVSAAGSYLTSACVNANTATVCDENNCSLGSTCGNRFECRYPLDLIESRVGRGVVSAHRIPQGSFIIEYVGEIVNSDDVDERDDQRYLAQFRTRPAWGEGAAVLVDALRCGNESRFINHSCQPNSVLYEYNWTNTTRLGIFAANDIPPLQEITFRYSRRYRQRFVCQCLVHTNE